MKNNFFLFFYLGLFLSCNGLKDRNVKAINEVDKTNKVVNNLLASKNDVMFFLGIENKVANLNHLIFFESADSIEVPENNDYWGPSTLRRISIEDAELLDSRIVNQKNFSVLILNNPVESSVAIFYKHKEEKVDRMIEMKHFPDSVLFHELNDTLLVCQYYWRNDYGTNASNARTYLFIGEKKGFFKCGYSVDDKRLNFENFVINEGEIQLTDHDINLQLVISSDTITRSGTVRSDMIFDLDYINFEMVVLSK